MRKSRAVLLLKFFNKSRLHTLPSLINKAYKDNPSMMEPIRNQIEMVTSYLSMTKMRLGTVFISLRTVPLDSCPLLRRSSKSYTHDDNSVPVKSINAWKLSDGRRLAARVCVQKWLTTRIRLFFVFRFLFSFLCNRRYLRGCSAEYFVYLREEFEDILDARRR